MAGIPNKCNRRVKICELFIVYVEGFIADDNGKLFYLNELFRLTFCLPLLLEFLFFCHFCRVYCIPHPLLREVFF